MTDTKIDHETDMALALWFTPQAIRDHFECDESDIGEWVASATDEQLARAGQNCLSSDILYRAFHEVLELEIGSAIKDGPTPASLFVFNNNYKDLSQVRAGGDLRPDRQVAVEHARPIKETVSA